MRKLFFLSIFIIGHISISNAQISNYNFCSGGFASSPWTCIGKNPNSSHFQNIGMITAVAAHPNYPQTIYAGGRACGLWKTTDGGANWVNKTDYLGIAALGINAIAIHPNNQNIILAGTSSMTV